MEGILAALQNLTQNLPGFVLWLVTVVLVSAVWAFFLNLKVPQAYNVAVIGFPRAGKTTLIISLFGEILAGRMKKVRARLSTRTTIERVESGLVKLQKGEPLGPTKDQDMFAFRTVIVLGSWLRKTLKVEIADFPGVMSEELGDGAESMLDPEFARWVNEADAFIFVIDLARCFIGVETGINRDYVVKARSAIRGAWQNTLNHHSAGERKLKSYPVVLAFTKADVINYLSDESDPDLRETIVTYGFSKLPGRPGEVRVDAVKFLKYKQEILDAFTDLRSFFEQTNRHYDEVFVSSLGALEEKRLGFEELLQAILPLPPT